MDSYGYERMEDLIKYANSKMLMCSSGITPRAFNDAPQTKEQNEHSIAREEIVAAKLVKGLKVDFFGGDKRRQCVYEDILSDANGMV